MTTEEERHNEAWKAVIDFAKAEIGLSTSVITILLGLVIVGQLSLSRSVVVTIVLLLGSVCLALLAFGKGIKALGSGTPQKPAVLCANMSAIVLIGSIAILAFSPPARPMSVDQVLAAVASSTQLLTQPTKPEFCRSIRLVGDSYELTYESGGKTNTVTYSLKDRQVKEIR